MFKPVSAPTSELFPGHDIQGFGGFIVADDGHARKFFGGRCLVRRALCLPHRADRPASDTSELWFSIRPPSAPAILTNSARGERQKQITARVNRFRSKPYTILLLGVSFERLQPPHMQLGNPDFDLRVRGHLLAVDLELFESACRVIEIEIAEDPEISADQEDSPGKLAIAFS